VGSLENTQKVSLVFFITIGLAHILSGMFVANGFMIREANLVNQALDIPFIVAALVYLYASVKISLLKAEKYPPVLDTVFIIGGIIIILGMISLNLLLPNIVR
jgi:hypothetical protein